MNLDANDLPLPGRELDRWIAENVFHRDPLNARHGLHDDGDIEYYWGYPVGHAIAPAYSTTYALFQVMEAMEGEWESTERLSWLRVRLFSPRESTDWDWERKDTRKRLIGEANVALCDYRDREHAYAHAVCCCAKMAKGGEE